MKNLPEIGKTYNCFDDGKIRKSRMYQVTITEIIPFEKADNEILELWKETISSCYWLFDKTDYFIKFTITNISAEIKDLHKNQKEIILNIKGIPNIRFLQNNIELKTKELINQIIVESIETINDRNNINTNTLEIYNDKFSSKYLNYSKE